MIRALATTLIWSAVLSLQSPALAAEPASEEATPHSKTHVFVVTYTWETGYSFRELDHLDVFIRPRIESEAIFQQFQGFGDDGQMSDRIFYCECEGEIATDDAARSFTVRRARLVPTEKPGSS